MSTGVEGKASALEQQLRALFNEGHRDTLIAGCADTGILALVARAAENHDSRIVALDICDTPLDLCRRLADRWSLPIETLRKDLVEFESDRQFDIVLVHGTLHFIAAKSRGEALARTQRALRPGGRLVLMFNTSHKVRTDAAERIRSDYASSVIDELARRGVPLPDQEDTIRERLYNHSRRREQREGAFASPDDAIHLMRSAGFDVERCVQVDVPLASPASGFIAEISKRRFMAVATPRPANAGPR